MQPGKLYVENVREFFGVSFKNAQFLCEEGTREGLLVRKIGLLCPNDQRIIYVVENEHSEPPEEIACDVCEDLERERSSFKPSELDRVMFYTLPSK